ncbi:MAG: TrbC/VirB2 family protein [Streptomycetaceae bacterium]|nr:TrbC/VirB2 family protein [Streptomycetaceae bacterium]
MNPFRKRAGRETADGPANSGVRRVAAIVVGGLISAVMVAGSAPSVAADERASSVAADKRAPMDNECTVNPEGTNLDACSEEAKDCLYVPEDIYGFLFTFYCVDLEKKGTYKEKHGVSMGFTHHAKGYMNGGIGTDCAGLPDDWQHHLNEFMDDFSFGLVGGQGTMTECVKKRMLKWLQDHQNNNLGQPVKLDLKDNPCNSIYDEKKLSDKNNNNCRSPVGRNPCLLIGSKSDQFRSKEGDTPLGREKEAKARNACLNDHKDFKQATPAMNEAKDGGCEYLKGDDQQNCKDLVEQSKAKAPADEDLKKELNKFLAWLLLATSCAIWLGILGTGAGMALSWYTGAPGLLQFSRLGWVVFAAVVSGAATSIAGFFLL